MIDICPYFCDEIVKSCWILYIFVGQSDGFQFQNILYDCPLESIKATGNSGNVTGTVIGWGAQGTGMFLRSGN